MSETPHLIPKIRLEDNYTLDIWRTVELASRVREGSRDDWQERAIGVHGTLHRAIDGEAESEDDRERDREPDDGRLEEEVAGADDEEGTTANHRALRRVRSEAKWRIASTSRDDDGLWEGSAWLRVTRDDCAEPWQRPFDSGNLYCDDGVLMSALRCTGWASSPAGSYRHAGHRDH